jgi:hypothetical protein
MKRALLLTLLVFSSLTLFSGCAAHRAAEGAAKDLKFAVIKSQLDGLGGLIEARTGQLRRSRSRPSRLPPAGHRSPHPRRRAW